jgi:hypothetical protein
MAVTYNYGAAPTYVKIANQTLSTTSASVTFSNIPQGYTDLRVVLQVKNSVGDGYAAQLQYNSDTASNYSWTGAAGYAGSSANSFRASSVAVQKVGFTSATSGSAWTSINIDILNYTNPTTFKSCLSRSNSVDTNSYVFMMVGLWRSTQPITSLTFTSESSGTFAAGSTFTLYGIEAAFVPKATGGDIIVQDGTYWYHAFRSTGSFVPNQSLSCDALVIAGGGSGAVQNSGGGGAGGYRSATGLSISSATTVTVGAGGAAVSSVGAGINGSDSVFSTITSTGGGAGRGYFANGAPGGSGGGAGGAAGGPAQTGGASSPATSPVQGYAGGNGSTDYEGGGGGGAGAVGGAGTAGVGGNGGAGSNSFSSWAATTSTGVNGFYAGGGGAGGSSTNGTGGSGGGGAGANGPVATSGAVNTGSGGGSQRITGMSGAGGSGLVIVRYPI